MKTLLLLMLLALASAATITITGAGKEATIFSGSSMTRVFDVASGSGIQLVDLTVQDGTETLSASSDVGGAIRLTDADELIMTSCVVKDNTAVSSVPLINSNAVGGGAIGVLRTALALSNETTTVILDDVWFSNNSVSGTSVLFGFGGALLLRDESGSINCTIVDSQFLTSTAQTDGGAVWSYGSGVSLTATNTTFLSNEAILGLGGAIGAFSQSVASLATCGFEGNQARFSGGAIYSSDSSVSVDDGMFDSNVALSLESGMTSGGGAIANRFNSTLVVSASVFTNNNASISVAFKGAGAILSSGESTTATITGSTFENNIGFCAGAVLNIHDVFNSSMIFVKSYMLIEDCVFEGNHGIDEPSGTNSIAGGFGAYFGTITDISRTRFAANTAEFGGAVYSESPETIVNIERCEFSENLAMFGGAINLFEGSTITVRLSTLSGNIADRGGGLGVIPTATPTAIYTIIVDQCTITNNTATTLGGGFDLNTVTSFTIGNTVVADNTSPTASDIGSASTATFTSAGHNLIRATSMGVDGMFPTVISDLTNMDPQLLPLAFNGGLTRSHLFSLTSPLLDSANPSVMDLTDQRAAGFVRTYNAIADIGSIEFQVACVTLDTCGICTVEDDITNSATVIAVTTFNDIIDPTDGLISVREAVGIANSRPGDQEIHLPSGTYQITLLGDDDDNCVGDLDIM